MMIDNTWAVDSYGSHEEGLVRWERGIEMEALLCSGDSGVGTVDLSLLKISSCVFVCSGREG